MFKYYLGLAIMCVIFAVMAVFFSEHGPTLTTIFLAMAGAFVALGFVTNGRASRW